MSTPRDNRALARHQRQQHLQVPQAGLGRADRIRSRSASPTAPGTFEYPPLPPSPKQAAEEIESEQFRDALSFSTTGNMATPEQLAAIRDQLRNELRNEVRAELRIEAAAAGAAIPDAIKRRPEIPAFDKAHIDHWIRRTENAFVRALIDSPREKFAFLETKFPVDLNPRINDYLWGPATQARWNEFLQYLRSEYGPTKQQRASVFIDGFKRDGKKPSQYAALLNDKTKDVTIDDIKKEMLVREMPTEVQRMLQEHIEDLTFEDAAKKADAYFDQDGRPRHINKSTTVNAVHEPSDEHSLANPDESDSVNAVGRRFLNQRPSGPGNFAQRVGRGRSQNWKTTRPPSVPQTSSQPNKTYDPSLCSYHNQFGDRAKNCAPGCARSDRGKATGNGRAGQR